MVARTEAAMAGDSIDGSLFYGLRLSEEEIGEKWLRQKERPPLFYVLYVKNRSPDFKQLGRLKL